MRVSIPRVRIRPRPMLIRPELKVVVLWSSLWCLAMLWHKTMSRLEI